MRPASVMALAILFGLISSPPFAGQRAGAPSSQPRQTEIATPPAVALPTARAQEAVRALKHKKLYDSLAAAYQAARYRVECNEHPAVPGQSAWHADNPAQEMSADFAADAVHITASESDGAAATVVLRLTGYGYSSNQQPPARAVPRADENRITYDRGVLREWYINDRGGLEQGFTLTQPPAVPTGEPLVLTMAIDSGLQTRLAADSGRIQFVDSMDRVQFQYADLKAWDAAGRKLPAKMLASNGRIALLINDSGATYPVTIDPLIFTEPKLTPSDPSAFDEFGNSVGISGDTAVIGAPGKSPLGATYVFVRSGSVWSQQQKLTPSDPSAFGTDEFGFSVGVSADTAVIGAPGILGVPNSSAYVFVRSGSLWSQQQKLTASDTSAGDRFGFSVGISGDTVVIGAPASSSFTGVARSAYVFVRSGSLWSQQQKLTASNPFVDDAFAISVGISGDTAVIGAPGRFPPATGTAYVFVRSGSLWSRQQKLTAGDPAVNDAFGFSVGISGDTAVIGASRKSELTGAAYVFMRSGSLWSQQQKLTASDPAAGDRFGDSVGISGDTAVIGAPFKSGFVGAAYVFEGVLIVSIDIKPGEGPPSINRQSHGKTPVALLSSPTFDATSADRRTVVFAGASPLNIGLDFVDVNRDGLLDVVFRFSTQSLNLPDGTTQACMTGRTIDRQDFKGCDSLRLLR